MSTTADTVYTLSSPHGNLQLQAIAYGATVTRLLVPDRHGKLADIVLGFSDPSRYRGPHPYFGATAGRVAGRITRAQFQLDGKTYHLAANDPPNHLHGGNRGFDKYMWDVEQLSNAKLQFCRTSPDGEEGYPGTVNVTITYELQDNALAIHVAAQSDRNTPFSLTHHSYFNLAGEGSGTSIESHELAIHADAFAPGDDKMGLTGRRQPVNAANDFRKLRNIGDAIPQLHGQHGDLYFLSAEGQVPMEAARLVHRQSGRVMNVLTNEACLQLYTGVGLDGSLIGKSGVPYRRCAGLCIECEGYPDGANTPALGDIILRPDPPIHRRTLYQFSTLPA